MMQTYSPWEEKSLCKNDKSRAFCDLFYLMHFTVGKPACSAGTVWKGITAMRISVSSWMTTEEDIKKCSEAIIKIAKQEINT